MKYGKYTYIYSRKDNKLDNRLFKNLTQARKLLFDISPKCALCGCEKSLSYFETDHILPCSFLGKTELNNLQLTCYNCHQLKTYLDIKVLNIAKKIGVIRKSGFQWYSWYNEKELKDLYYKLLSQVKKVRRRKIIDDEQEAPIYKLEYERLEKMIKEFELKKIDETDKWIQYEVKRKGLYYGLLTIEKNEDIKNDCTILKLN